VPALTINFGLHLDGQCGVAPANRLGDLHVGPMGLLSVLETQLGLVAPSVSQAQRVVQYRDCLQRLNGPSRFYAKSFAADDFGAASTLLNWRDQWRLHGWNGAFAAAAGNRLADMAEIEPLAQESVSPGIGERLTRVNEALARCRTQIGSITLLDPLESLPATWRSVLSALPVIAATPPAVCAKGMLGELQEAIISLQANRSVEMINWRNDDSLHVIRAETALAAGRWLASAIDRSEPDTLLVVTAEAGLMDSMVGAADQPLQGFSEASAFRPALQVLPLVLELLWEPLNFHALIQFLTHPISPLPGYVRRTLARVQTERPGIGGPKWAEALKGIATRAGDGAPKVGQAIADWVDHPRFAPEKGVPAKVVLECAERLATFFQRCPADADAGRRLAYASGQSQCLAFIDGIGRLIVQGVSTLNPRQLEQLASQATARGGDNPMHMAEVGAMPCVTHPGAVTESFATVIWGPLAAPALPAQYPWSVTELSSLREAGADLPDPGVLLAREAADWTRPILAARKRLVLLLPPAGQEFHPVWQAVEMLIKDLPVESLESVLSEGGDAVQPIAHRPLNRHKRWWQLPEGIEVPKVEKYSFSQVERQLFNPYHWLLTYPAQLRSGSLLSLADDFRLKGLLAHTLVERLYDESDGLSMSDAQFSAWFGPAFDRLIAQEGALYLMPGRRTDLENLRITLRRALMELRRLLASSGVTQADAERPLAGSFAGGPMIGSSDLVLTKADKSQAIIDMKWAGKNHKVKLEENRHLQLAIYGELLRQATGRWPKVSYFLLSQARLLVRDNDFFSGIQPVQDRTGENIAQLWERFLVTWKWRQAQFAEGRYEVVLEKSEEDESRPPDDGLGIDVLNAAYNDCVTLAGWGDGA
jgi:hypothetical protein